MAFMVMLVVVDDDLSNIEHAKKVRFRGKARERLDEQFARLAAPQRQAPSNG